MAHDEVFPAAPEAQPLATPAAGALAPPIDERALRRVAGASLALGALAQILFYGHDTGLNLPLGTIAALAGAWLARRPDHRIDRADVWIAPAALAFAAMAAVRSDSALVLFDTLAALALTGASFAVIAGVHVTRRTTTTALFVASAFAAATFAGALYLGTPARRWTRHAARHVDSDAWRVVRGLAIAAPIVAVFAVLFAAADAVFARLASDVLAPSVDVWDVTARLLFTTGVAWLAAGSLVFVAFPRWWVDASGGPVAPAERLGDRASRRLRLGTVEAVVILVAVDALFALFVALQATYLFGGRETLDAAGLTYSEYARRGFFELIAVAVAAGALLLSLETTVDRRSRAYVVAAVVLALLTGVVLASAGLRLALYQAAYGWTELRFYAAAAIAWLAVGVTFAAATIALGRTRRLPHALVLSAVAVALGVNLLGPQAYVTAENVRRALHPELVAAGGESGLDAAYLSTLGDDAVPVLIEALPSLPPAEAAEVRRGLRSRLREIDRDGEPSWQSWNLARERARALLGQARGQLGLR